MNYETLEQVAKFRYLNGNTDPARSMEAEVKVGERR